MTKELNVKVVKNGCNRLLMYFNDPRTGRRKWRKLASTDEKEAQREAGRWQDELQANGARTAKNVSWEEFRRLYEREAVDDMATKTVAMINTVFNLVEKVCRPKRLDELNEDRLLFFRDEIREGRSPATVRSYMAHLLSALGWAFNAKMLQVKASLPRQRRSRKKRKAMKGSPVTNNQFEAMLANIEAGLLTANTPLRSRKSKRPVKQPAVALSAEARARFDAKRKGQAGAVVESWHRLLIGLWLSGLRLGEALNFHWCGRHGIRLDLSSKRPRLAIPAECEKGAQDRLLPLTPDFAAWLLQTPEGERHGRVFKPIGFRGEPCRQVRWVGRIISAIGRAADVKVTDEDGRLKYASAHDLRRAFGTRWAPRCMPAVLQQIMRHEDIQTTMKYYVGLEADDLADELWAKHETDSAVNRIVNLVSSSASNGSATEKPQTLEDSRLIA